MTQRAPGPAWVGIGAQRSGTTWFTGLLTQHPGVGLAGNGRKEQHAFDTAAVDGWADDAAAAYRRLFEDGSAMRRGEFTPAYLRLPHVPALLAETCPEPPLLLVILRDPVARYHSAMRWYAEQREDRRRRPTPRTHRQFTEQAVWAGMYATQLEFWSRVFDRDRFVVLQYEAVRLDPASAVTGVVERLGLDPAPIGGADRPSSTSTDARDDVAFPGLDDALRSAYRPEVARLADTWGIDPSLWPRVA